MQRHDETDNGSGSATILEIAEQMTKVKPREQGNSASSCSLPSRWFTEGRNGSVRAGSV